MLLLASSVRRCETVRQCCVQVALMGQGVAMGTMPSGARAQLQSVQVPWLEVHAPGGLQVAYSCASMHAHKPTNPCHDATLPHPAGEGT